MKINEENNLDQLIESHGINKLNINHFVTNIDFSSKENLIMKKINKKIRFNIILKRFINLLLTFIFLTIMLYELNNLVYILGLSASRFIWILVAYQSILKNVWSLISILLIIFTILTLFLKISKDIKVY